MEYDLSNKLIVAISSSALFNLDESHAVYEHQGVEAYTKYQIENENNTLEPGVAFPLVKKLMNLRSPQTDELLVEVILLSRNSADAGLRIFNSIQDHKLNICRAVFTRGKSPCPYISAFGSHIFLSANEEDVRDALNAGCAAATVYPGSKTYQESNEVRIAFDGDAVLFSDEAERVFQDKGLDSFSQAEKDAAKQPLAEGPFKGFLVALEGVQQHFVNNDDCPIRTALITSRAAPTHERVLRTLRAWDIRIDEVLFLGGINKGGLLEAFGADIFFDDQQSHCEVTSEYVATAHVPYGVCGDTLNKEGESK